MAYYPPTSSEQWSGPPTYNESNENYSSIEYDDYSNGYPDASRDPIRQIQKTISAKNDSTLITNEVVLNRVTSGKKPAISAARGDAVKKKLELDKIEPSIKPFSGDSLGSKNPVTLSEKFQAWMINEGNELFCILDDSVC